MKSNNLATERRYHAVTLTFHSWVDPERLVSHDQTVLTNISKIKQSAAELLIKTHFANFCHRYVMLWPWPSTHWPWTFVVHRMSCVQNVYSIWVKSNNPWLSYWRFGNFFRPFIQGGGGMGANCVHRRSQSPGEQLIPNLERSHLRFQRGYPILGSLRFYGNQRPNFEIWPPLKVREGEQNVWVRTKVNNNRHFNCKFSTSETPFRDQSASKATRVVNQGHFFTFCCPPFPVKFREGVGRMSEWIFQVQLTSIPLIQALLMPGRGCTAWSGLSNGKKRTKAKHKVFATIVERP